MLLLDVCARWCLTTNGCFCLDFGIWEIAPESGACDGGIFVFGDLEFITSALRDRVTQLYATIWLWQNLIENLGNDFRAHVLGRLISPQDRVPRFNQHPTSDSTSAVLNHERNASTNNELLSVGI